MFPVAPQGNRIAPQYAESQYVIKRVFGLPTKCSPKSSFRATNKYNKDTEKGDLSQFYLNNSACYTVTSCPAGANI